MQRFLTERVQRGGFYTGKQPIYMLVRNANNTRVSVVHRIITGMSITDFERAYGEQDFEYYSTKAEAKARVRETTPKDIEIDEFRKALTPAPIRHRNGLVRLVHPV